MDGRRRGIRRRVLLGWDRPRGRPGVALMVDNIEMAQETLGIKGFGMITEGDLLQED